MQLRKSITERRAAFRALHRSGCFVLPNPWDLGSLRRLERLGFDAVASTSAGCAWSLGRDDGQLSRQEVLDHLALLTGSTDLPVNADFEDGFPDEPGGVAESVRLAIETGIAGLSIEDRERSGLAPMATGVERIRLARAAIDRSGADVMLVGRSEGFLLGQPDLRDTIARLIAYADAGADCLYAPGVKAAADITAIVAAVAPRPVNVLLIGPDMRVADLAALDVRRVSIGGALAAAAWAGFDQAARQLVETGTLPPRPSV